MQLKEEIFRIKKLMSLNENKIITKNLFKKFDLSNFKSLPPPSDNSKETKKEIQYLKQIDLKKRFVQEKDNIPQNFIDFLEEKNINETKLINKLVNDVRYIILELKNFYKRPRPFRVDPNLTDPMLKSMEGFAYRLT